MTLTGKHAVVTGGNRGIGAAIVRALQEHGARVTVVHRATVDVADGDAVARAFAGMESQEAVMTSVDRLGFHVRLKTKDGVRGARVAFQREVRNPGDTRKVLVEMVQQARQT